MTLYNIFNTKEEADAAQAYDFGKFMKSRLADAAYVAATVCWADVIALPDGKFGYIPCQASDSSYATGEYTLDTGDNDLL